MHIFGGATAAPPSPHALRCPNLRRREKSIRRQFATARRVLAARNGILCVKKSFMLYQVQDLSIWNLEFKASKLELFPIPKMPAAPRGVKANAPLNPAPFCVVPRLRRREKSILGQFATYRRVLPAIEKFGCLPLGAQRRRPQAPTPCDVQI